VEVRLWHEFGRYVSLIAANTTGGRSLFAPAFLCEHSRNGSAACDCQAGAPWPLSSSEENALIMT
jgi:hypothetical protein